MKSLIYAGLIAIPFTISCNSPAPPPADPIPAHDSFTLDSKQVGETRTINVWLPKSYAQSADSLPVLYMADGGVKEDFPHIANTLDSLINIKKVPPFILVGIENTERRRDLSGFTEVEKDKEIAKVVGGSDKFAAFMRDELFPEINKRYRTTAKKGILGESLSGLFVMENFFLHPETYDYYIAFDPSLWWNNHYLVRTANEHLAKLPPNKKVLWFAGSSATDISTYTNQLATILKSNTNPNLVWTYSDEPKEEHQTIFRATKNKAFIWALNQ